MTRYVRPAGAALLVGAIHLALASRMSAPIIMADEWGYLGAARRIAGDGEQTHVPYHAGAGLLYLPTTLLADSADRRVPRRPGHQRPPGRAADARRLVGGRAGRVAAAALGAVRGGVRRGPLHLVRRLLQPGGARGGLRRAGAGARGRVRTGAARPACDVVGAGRSRLRRRVAAAPARRRRDRRRRRRRGRRAAAAGAAPAAAGRLCRAGAGRGRRHDRARRLGERHRARSRAVRLRRAAGRPAQRPRARTCW